MMLLEKLVFPVTVSTLNLMLPGEGLSLNMYAVTTYSVGNPFNRVNFNLERHAYLEGLKFADKYPSTGEPEFEMIASKPYFSKLERAEEVKSPNPSLPMARLTALNMLKRSFSSWSA